jgi:hypothetical protein
VKQSPEIETSQELWEHSVEQESREGMEENCDSVTKAIWFYLK